MRFSRRTVVYGLPLGLILAESVLRELLSVDLTGVLAGGLGAAGLGLLAANLPPLSATISDRVRRVLQEEGIMVVAVIDKTGDFLFGTTFVFFLLAIVLWMGAVGIELQGTNLHYAGVQVGGLVLGSINMVFGAVFNEIRMHYER